MVTNQMAKRSSISISVQAKQALDSIKGQGQSYDGLIREMVKFWKDKKGEYWTRRRAQRLAQSRAKDKAG